MFSQVASAIFAGFGFICVEVFPSCIPSFPGYGFYLCGRFPKLHRWPFRLWMLFLWKFFQIVSGSAAFTAFAGAFKLPRTGPLGLQHLQQLRGPLKLLGALWGYGIYSICGGFKTPSEPSGATALTALAEASKTPRNPLGPQRLQHLRHL